MDAVNKLAIIIVMAIMAGDLIISAAGDELPTDVLSPVDGPFVLANTLKDCPAAGEQPARWCFNQHQGPKHKGKVGIGGANDTYAWDINLNSPERDYDNGLPVKAASEGVVCKSFGTGLNPDKDGVSYGQVLINHSSPGPWWSGYLHLKNITVSAGQNVTSETIIGYISDVSKDDISPHLHFAVYNGSNTYMGLTSFNANIVQRGSSIPKKATANPIPPRIISPGSASSEGDVIDELEPTFNWEGVQGADSYAVFVSKQPYGKEFLVFDSTENYSGLITGTSFKLPVSLQPSTSYRWNMMAHTSAGWSDASSVLYFKTSGQDLANQTLQVNGSSNATPTPSMPAQAADIPIQTTTVTSDTPSRDILEGIPSFSQGTEPWCAWVSAQMVLAYYGCRVEPKDVAKRTFELANQEWTGGGLTTDPVLLDSYKKAIVTLSSNSLVLEEVTERDGDILLNIMKSAINDGNPVIIASNGAWLFDLSDWLQGIKWPDGGHASVLVGYSMTREGLVKELPVLGVEPPAIRLHDPATASLGVGAYWLTYETFFNKTTTEDSFLKLWIVKRNLSSSGPQMPDNGHTNVSSTKMPIKPMDLEVRGRLAELWNSSNGSIGICRIMVESVNQSGSNASGLPAKGDSVFVLMNHPCMNGSEPSGRLTPAGWTPAVGDYALVKGNTSISSENWTEAHVPLNETLITICGSWSYAFSLDDPHPPTLSSASSTPRLGSEDGIYRFSVVYEDEDGDEPVEALIRILGYGPAKVAPGRYSIRRIYEETADMVFSSGNAKAGANYVYTTKLPPGEYEYHFLFKNKRGKSVYLPDGASGYPDIFGPKVGLSWPFEPITASHPILQGYGDYLPTDQLHGALDILSPVGSAVYAVESGDVIDVQRSGESDESVFVKGYYSGKIFQYTHIELDGAISDGRQKGWLGVKAGQVLGRTRLVDETGFIRPHLHIAIFDGNTDLRSFDSADLAYVPPSDNPILFLTPQPQYDEAPLVKEILFRSDESSGKKYFSAGKDGIISVCGKVDIVANSHDAIGASETVGPYKISYSVLDNAGSVIIPQSSLVEWNGAIEDLGSPTTAIYETGRGYPRSTYYNPWYILTNAVSSSGGARRWDAAGCWDTKEMDQDGRPRFPDGLYDVVVEAYDARGFVKGEKKVDVRVNNGAGCSFDELDNSGARIVSPIFWPDKPVFAPLDTVSVYFTFVNSGKSPHDYWMSASVRGPDLLWREMDLAEASGNATTRAPGPRHEISVGPGETRGAEFQWTIPQDAPAGSCELAISVRSNKDDADPAAQLDRLTMPGGFNIVFAEMDLQATADRSMYEPGDIARISVNVTNMMNSSAEVWPELRLRDPVGEVVRYTPLIELSEKHLLVEANRTMNFTANISLPSDAPAGRYELSVDISKDKEGRENYSDSILYEPIFYVAHRVEVVPVDMILVLDRSGSMEEALDGVRKIDLTSEAARQAVSALLYNSSNNRVSIVSFSDNSRTDLEMNGDLSSAVNAINSLSPYGATSYGLGMREAMGSQVLSNDTGRLPVILFLSDGLHNTYPDPWDFVQEAKRKGIRIFTIGVGSSADHSLLQQMADQTGGKYQFAAKGSMLEDIFLELTHTASGWRILDTFVGSVSQGNWSTAGNVSVPSGTRFLRIDLTWPGSEMNIEVIGPDGRVVDPANYTIIRSSDARLKTIIIADPKPGDYLIRVYGKELNGVEEFKVRAYDYEPPSRPRFSGLNVTVQERSGLDLADYPVLIDLKPDSFPAKTGEDVPDVRVYDSGGDELKSWIESWDKKNRTAKVWVKVPHIAAKGKAGLVISIGGNGDEGLGKGEDVFELFDDFNDGSIDRKKWSFSEDVSEKDGSIRLHSNARSNSSSDLISNERFKPNVSLVFGAFVSKGQMRDRKGLGFLGGNVGSAPSNEPSNVCWLARDANLFTRHNFSISGGVDQNAEQKKSNYRSGYRRFVVSWTSSDIEFEAKGEGESLQSRHSRTKPPASEIPVMFSLNTTVATMPSDIAIDWMALWKSAPVQPSVIVE